ncbi:GAF domain-containing protein [Synechocystis sp. PCC 7509]|uniref:GAF domain-containing protein n=1 Tax=Synechocystis sp. PCC 7509 TaxID=927677 RepID=UPI0002ABD4E7|nr:GAF domain-containing protein [Synechocystis sp. PCC 7509]
MTTIDKIFNDYQEPVAVFTALLPEIGEILQCDRIFLYLRNPQTKFGKVVNCWRRSLEIPDVDDYQWKQEPESLPQEDPLFAAALCNKPSIFVEDVETASIDVVDRDFEQKTFGHRALVHAHLCQDGQLWGILQPCVFDKPRNWTKSDRVLISQVENKLTPLAIKYITNIAILFDL